jgi:hypothetical protein
MAVIFQKPIAALTSLMIDGSRKRDLRVTLSS